LFAAWPSVRRDDIASRKLELSRWFAVWSPAATALTVAAWLCGWALSQPDPVPGHVSGLIFVVAAPFLVIGGRALLRALWSLGHSPCSYGIATVGLLHPRIVIAPELERALDARALRAALAHERTHVLHRDPLRIWLAQFVTDLQWPWGPAQRRFADWLAVLEIARDDEARAGGIDGADLAAAVLGSVRFQLRVSGAAATLIGRPQALPRRIARLLSPLPAGAAATRDIETPYVALTGGLLFVWICAIGLGLTCGKPLIDSLLAINGP
jgi:Zn-dependent protease with chaperone function